MTNEMRSIIAAENTETFRALEESGHALILVGLGGSHAYGTNVEGSDIDVRGVYANSVDELLGLTQDREQYVTLEADTTIYSLRKAAWLIKGCNPAMLEMLACRDEDYYIMTDAGRLLRDNLHIFLSKRAIKTFGGYSRSQLNRLINRSGRATTDLAANEQRSYEKAFMSLAARHKHYVADSATIKREGDDLLLSFSVSNMPVKEVSHLLSEFDSIDKSYRKSRRNDYATTKGKLAKHMMHLIRLYMMGIELMENQEVHTFRDGDEHSLLMAIRNGDYLQSDGLVPTDEFNQLVEFYSNKYNKACENTLLPDEPNMDAINKLLVRINYAILSGGPNA